LFQYNCSVFGAWKQKIPINSISIINQNDQVSQQNPQL